MSTGINFCKNRPIHYYVLPNNTDLLCRTPFHGLSTLSLPDQEKVEGNHTSVLRQLSQFAPVPKRKDTPRKSSTLIVGPRKSVGLQRKSTFRMDDDPPTNGVNSNHYIKTLMKEQRLQRKKSMREESGRAQIGSPDGTLLQVQLPLRQNGTPQTSTQLPDLHSDRDPLGDLFGDTQKVDSNKQLMVYSVFFLQRLALEQTIILVMDYYKIQYYIYLPVSLLSSQVIRVQEYFGYNWIAITLTLIIHCGSVVSQVILDSGEFETFSYLFVLAVEVVFSVLVYVLLKKCR